MNMIRRDGMALYGLGGPHTPLEIHIEWQERVAVSLLHHNNFATTVVGIK